MSEGHTGRLESALAGSYRIERPLGQGGQHPHIIFVLDWERLLTGGREP